ncbi:MAG TPA: fumarylacetoacetate hydrolase family protein [Albitalea sp.]|jgi:2-keto-4-pentenoate hydratase|nr:fumarylacetoacetate hydrolase family protein [Albitalea sp.]
MPTDSPQQVVQALVQARRTHRAAEAAALADALSTPQEAYAAQAAVAQALAWFDGAPRHWKSGGPSRDKPLTHAPLPPAGVWSSPAAAGAWPLHSRGIEAEVALRLGMPVDAGLAATLTESSAARLVDAMAVSIEIVDSRWREGGAAAALLRLADLQSHGALVLGDWLPFQSRDWSAQRCRVRIGARPMVERQGSHSLGDPAWLLPLWLRHATQGAQVVPAGTVVTTGTWVGLLQAAAGERVDVEFDGIGSASVQL